MATTPKRVIELLKAEIPAKISLNKFCKKTGINPNSVDKYMAGVTEPTQASLQKLSDYFKVPVWELRGDNLMETRREITRHMANNDKKRTDELIEIFNVVPDKLKGTAYITIIDFAYQISTELKEFEDAMTPEDKMILKECVRKLRRVDGTPYISGCPKPCNSVNCGNCESRDDCDYRDE